MPELPEVETVRRGLAVALAGRTLERVEIRDGRLTAPADSDAVAHALHGAAVTGVGRRGKYLVIGLDDGGSLVCHLRMTGWFHHVAEPAERPHLRALFGLDDGSWLLYSDQRRFGTMRLLDPDEEESYWRGRRGRGDAGSLQRLRPVGPALPALRRRDRQDPRRPARHPPLPEMHPTALRFQQRAAEAGLDVTVEELAESTRTAVEAAAAVG